MTTFILGLFCLALIGVSLFCFLRMRELRTENAFLARQADKLDREDLEEVGVLKAELALLQKYAHVPGIVDRAKRLNRNAEDELLRAQANADKILAEASQNAEHIKNEASVAAKRLELQILAETRNDTLKAKEARQLAEQEAEAIKAKLLKQFEADLTEAKEARRVAKWQAENLLEEARKEAKEIAKVARKDAKEKTGKVDNQLRLASIYAMEIRQKAESRAEKIAGEAYETKRMHDQYAAAYKALQNAMGGYVDIYAIPSDHLLDELADDYGFHEAGEKLKLARQRSQIMREKGLAADCNYPEGWKRDYAISFVLSAFDGKVDSILSRIKPANHGKIAQEIKDAFAAVNQNGEVFKGARIQEEYLDARLQELRWGVAVQRVKERQRDEQRAIREQIKEEERARKEFERAIKQAEKEEAAIDRAIEKVRQEMEHASAQERAAYEAQLAELNAKHLEAEARGQRAISMAQQTKRGHVYIISNVGSFGEDVYKIGLTRRLEPSDRIRELSGASVPFPFDVHAMIHSDDAPALESTLHRKFLGSQVNKANKRKEFFRVSLRDIRSVVDELGLSARWTIAAEATDYKETLALEGAMRDDSEFAKHWLEDRDAYEANQSARDDEEFEEELDAIAVGQADD